MATTVPEIVEQATSETLIAEDWEKNLYICDVIAAYPEEAPKAVAKAVRKRLGHKNPKVQLLTISLLETLVKNSQFPFHQQVSDKDFQKEILSVLEKDMKKSRTGRPTEVGNRLLGLVETWAEAFAQFERDLPGFQSTYRKLREKGVQFPARNVDEMPPVLTPPSRAPDPRFTSAYDVPASRSGGAQRSQAAPADPESMRRKLVGDLQVVRETLGVFHEILSGASSAQETRESEMIAELHAQVAEMKKRIVKLIEDMPVEDMLQPLFDINDEIDAAISRYEGKLAGQADLGPPSGTGGVQASNQGARQGNASNVLHDFDDLMDPRNAHQQAAAQRGPDIFLPPPPAAAGDDDFASLANRPRSSSQAKQQEPASAPYSRNADDDEFAMLANRSRQTGALASNIPPLDPPPAYNPVAAAAVPASQPQASNDPFAFMGQSLPPVGPPPSSTVPPSDAFSSMAVSTPAVIPVAVAAPPVADAHQASTHSSSGVQQPEEDDFDAFLNSRLSAKQQGGSSVGGHQSVGEKAKEPSARKQTQLAQSEQFFEL